MSTKVTIKGQVTLPKAVRKAANIHAGDNVRVTARAQGGVLIEIVPSLDHQDYTKRLKKMSERHPFTGTTDEIMALTRSER